MRRRRRGGGETSALNCWSSKAILVALIIDVLHMLPIASWLGEAAIRIELSLSGIASFANSLCGLAMAGSSPAMTGLGGDYDGVGGAAMTGLGVRL
jgi:hypothetical protein